MTRREPNQTCPVTNVCPFYAMIDFAMGQSLMNVYLAFEEKRRQRLYQHLAELEPSKTIVEALVKENDELRAWKMAAKQTLLREGLPLPPK
jgi:hypothetical protein